MITISHYLCCMTQFFFEKKGHSKNDRNSGNIKKLWWRECHHQSIKHDLKQNKTKRKKNERNNKQKKETKE